MVDPELRLLPAGETGELCIIGPGVAEGIEEMAKRGEDTMRFGPLKPVGLPDPRTGKDPYAVVQLRQDNAAGSLYNIVGFKPI